MRRQVDEMNVETMGAQPARGFDAEESATDHHCCASVACAHRHSIAVLDRAEDERAVSQRPIVVHQSRDWRQQRATPGRDDQPVVGFDESSPRLPGG